MLRAKCLLTFLLLSVALAVPVAAQRRVSGRITDQNNGQPLPGASVQIQGTRFGTSAGDSGTFALQVPDGAITLVVRRIGYQRSEIILPPGEARLDVSLRRDVLQLETQVTT